MISSQGNPPWRDTCLQQDVSSILFMYALIYANTRLIHVQCLLSSIEQKNQGLRNGMPCSEKKIIGFWRNCDSERWNRVQVGHLSEESSEGFFGMVKEMDCVTLQPSTWRVRAADHHCCRFRFSFPRDFQSSSLQIGRPRKTHLLLMKSLLPHRGFLPFFFAFFLRKIRVAFFTIIRYSELHFGNCCDVCMLGWSNHGIAFSLARNRLGMQNDEVIRIWTWSRKDLILGGVPRLSERRGISQFTFSHLQQSNAQEDSP